MKENGHTWDRNKMLSNKKRKIKSHLKIQVLTIGFYIFLCVSDEDIFKTI